MPLWWRLSWLFFILVEHYGIKSDFEAKIPEASSTSPSSVASPSTWNSSPLRGPTSSHQATPERSPLPRPWFPCPVAKSNVERSALPGMGGMDVPPMWPEQWKVHRILRPLWDEMDARSLCLFFWQRPLASAARLDWPSCRRPDPETWTRPQTLPATPRSEQGRWQEQRQRCGSPWQRKRTCTSTSRRQRCQQSQGEEWKQGSHWETRRTGLGLSGDHCRTSSPKSAYSPASSAHRPGRCCPHPADDPPQQLRWPTRRCSGSFEGHYVTGAATDCPQPSLRSVEMDQSPRSSSRGIASPPDFAQCLAFLRRGGYEPLGELCCRFSGRRYPTPAAHPNRNGCFPASPERPGWTTCVGGQGYSRCCGTHRARQCGCGYGCFPRAPKIESELSPHHRWFGYHGDYTSRSSRTIQCRDPGPGASRPSTTCSTPPGRANTHACSSGDSYTSGYNRSSWPSYDCGGRRGARPWSNRAKWIFLIGRWIGPDEIVRQWPLVGAQPGLAWMHPVCQSPDFLSPWQASCDALELAYACGNYATSSSSPTAWPSLNLSRSSAKPVSSGLCTTKSLSFATQFELCIGFEDQSTFAQVTLPESVLHDWSDKPWGLHDCGAVPDFEIARLLGEVVLPAPPSGSRTVIAGQPFEHRALTQFPAWIQSIWPTFVAGARYYQRRPLPTAYVRTWFLDDLRVHEWHRWRELEVDPGVEDWHGRLLALWRDQLLPPAAFEIHLVEPTVPAIPGWETHLGDLIILQSPLPTRRAILTRTEVRFADEVRLQLVAYSVPVRQPFHDLLRRVRLTFYTWRHPCTVFRGPRQLVDGLVEHVQASGISFTVDMESDDHSLLHLQAVMTPAVPLDDLVLNKVALEAEEVTSLMQTMPATSPQEVIDCRQQLSLGVDDWTHDVFHRWFHDGAIACDSVGPELFVQTWFVHHDLQRTCLEPRTWIATAPRATWEHQLRELWDDVIDPAANLGIHFVQPRPPDTDWRHFSGHLMLVQGDPSYRAVLLSAMYRERPGFHVVQAAFSSLRQTDGHYISRLLGASQFCSSVPCAILLGGVRLPLHQVLALHDGLALTLDVAPSPAEPALDEEFSLLALVRPSPAEPSPPLLMDDPAIVELDEFIDDAHEEDDWSSQDSGTWHPSMIYSVRIDELAGHTNWASYDDLHSSAMDILHPDGDGLVAVHHVAHPPWDHHRENTAVFVAEFPEDQGRSHALVLVDVGFFQNRADEIGDVTVRIARSIALSSTRRDALDLLGLQRYCDALADGPPGPGCLVRLNHELVPAQNTQPLAWAHGDYFRVALPPASQLPEDFSVRRAAALCHRGHSLDHIGLTDPWRLEDEISEDELLPLNLPPAESPPSLEDHDETALMQAAPCFCESGFGSPRGEDWEDILHTLWLHAFYGAVGPDTQRPLPSALTWYLDHERAPHTFESRALPLRPERHAWRTDLQQLWRDHVDPGVPFDVVLVRPPPFAAPPHFLTFLILVQRPIPHYASTLVALIDDAIDPWRSEISALAVPSTLQSSVLLQLMDLAIRCPPHGQDWQCTTYDPRGDPFIDPTVVPIADGSALMVSIARLVPRALDLDFLPPDHLALLQLGFRRVRDQLHLEDAHPVAFDLLQRPAHPQPSIQPIVLADAVPPPPVVSTLDCTSVCQAIALIDELFLTPSFEIDELLPWHPSAPWLLDWWDGCSPFDELAVYFDGAYFPPPRAASGIGVIAFVRLGASWYFAGFLATPLPAEADSYQAEQMAGVTAVKLIYDLLRIRSAVTTTPVLVGLYYDSVTVGMQAQGLWRAHQHPKIGKALRSLVRLCQSLFPSTWTFEHVRGHIGEPGNEFADYAAAAAANHWQPFCMDLARWFQLLENQTFLGGIEWGWLLFDGAFANFWSASHLHLPGPSLQMNSDLLFQVDTPTRRTEDCSHLVLRLASFNVLSVAGEAAHSTGLSGPSRFELVLRQMSDLQVQIFCLQETRIRHSLPTTTEHFRLFQSPADDRGHFGLVVGFSKTFLERADIKILFQSPRALVLCVTVRGLRFLLFGPHAPHSGTTVEELSAWWTDIASAVPPRYRDWPAVALVDANAVVGDCPSDHVGDFQAASFDPKAAPFLDFLTSFNLFLPSTFDTWQFGQGATWTHPCGHRRRIDYIGLPLEWIFTQGTAWVQDDFETGRGDGDHCPVFIEATLQFTPAPASSKAIHRHAFPRDAFEDLPEGCLQALPCIPWSFDVHSHAALLQSHTSQILQDCSRRRSPKPIKKTLSEATWTLVCQKRATRRSLFELNSFQRLLTLRGFFVAWTSSLTPSLALPACVRSSWWSGRTLGSAWGATFLAGYTEVFAHYAEAQIIHSTPLFGLPWDWMGWLLLQLGSRAYCWAYPAHCWVSATSTSFSCPGPSQRSWAAIAQPLGRRPSGDYAPPLNRLGSVAIRAFSSFCPRLGQGFIPTFLEDFAPECWAGSI